VQPKNLKDKKYARKKGKTCNKAQKTPSDRPVAYFSQVAVRVTLKYHQLKQIPFHHPATK
jgi:hypothetical protein